MIQCVFQDDSFPQTLLLHPCEETIVDQLKNIADNYRSINEFTKIIPQFGEEQVVLGKYNNLLIDSF